MATSSYRPLTHDEVELLTRQGCTASDWSHVQVAPQFTTSRVERVRFEGEIRLGAWDAPTTSLRPRGLSDATLRDVTIGDNCDIREVDLVEHYRLGDEVVLQHVGTLTAPAGCTFGNGVRVSVLNECGGREVPIYEDLTAQEAYVLALHRYNEGAIGALEQRIEDFAAHCATPGEVGDRCEIRYVREVRGVRFYPETRVIGAARLVNGTLRSAQGQPVVITDGVDAEDFIVCPGTEIKNRVTLLRCFVGEHCHFCNGFTASDSLFFANCQMENGEACALWAGPFSVSHHKSTLLIAGMVSFFNAGSGSNQSNHSYKLGPNKYGILERGAKLASGSYLYWPARAGAFSTVLGHHSGHPDAGAFPFSLLLEEEGKSLLIPAVNLRSIGLLRDCCKWPERDKRSATGRKQDVITFALLNPYTAARIEAALHHIKGWMEEASTADKSPYIAWRGALIPRKALERAYQTYSAALDEYLCAAILRHADRRTSVAADAPGCGTWLDYGGMIAPQAEVEQTNGEPRFDFSAEQWAAWEWQWIAQAAQRLYGHAPAEMGAIEMEKISILYELTSEWLQSERLADAQKEYDATARLLYGADGNDAQRDSEFEAQYGASCLEDKFVRRWQEQWKDQRDALLSIAQQFRADTDR